MYCKFCLSLIIILSLGSPAILRASTNLPSLKNTNLKVETDHGITTRLISPNLLMALDYHFNQIKDPELNNDFLVKPQPISPDIQSTFDEYLSSFNFDDPNGSDNLNEKISTNTLNDYRKLTSKARSYIAQARDISTIIRGLSGSDLVELPIALRFSPLTDKPDFAITLVIVDIKLYPKYTLLHSYLMVESAELSEEPLIFYSPNIKFSMKSGIIGDNTLGLMGDYPLPVFTEKAVLKLKRGIINETNNQGIGTFAVIGCDGLKNLSIGADLIFSRDWIKPAVNWQNPDHRVTAQIQLQELQDLSNIYADLSIEPFVLNGLEDFVWNASNIAVDMSEKISPPGIMGKSEMLYFGLPDGNGNPIRYTHSFSNPGSLWKGFYIGSIGVSIPDKLNPDQADLIIRAEHLIFDDMGISGQASVEAAPLLEFGSSDLNGFAFGIDEMTLTVVESQHLSASFAGLIHIPLLGSQEEETGPSASALYYEALIDPLNGYQFMAGFNDRKTIPMLVAEADIHPTSYLQVIFDNEAKITAMINADIHIQKELSNSLELDLPGIGIRNVVVRNFGDKLNLHTDQWEVDLTEKMDFGLFSLELDPSQNKAIGSNYSVINSTPTTAIDFNAKVTLSMEENLTGTGSFSIKGRLQEEKGLEKWIHDDLVLNAFCVKGEGIIPGIEKMEGCLEFYNADQAGIWGDGFRGFLEIKASRVFDKMKMIAQFGQTGQAENGGFQYYLIDATASLDRGIPLGGSIYLNGFGGGYFKNLQRPEATLAFDQILLPDYSDFFVQDYGASMSGVKYTLPNDFIETYGFKGTAILSTDPSLEEGKKVGFSSNLELGMDYSRTVGGEEGWGIQNIYFQGVGEFMSGFDPGRVIKKYSDFTPGTELEDLENLSAFALGDEEKTSLPASLPIDGSMISAKVLLQASFDCPAFYGILGVYLNAGMIYGQSLAEMYIGRHCSADIEGHGTDWHLFIGKSTAPSQLGVELPIIGDLARMWAYFMMGNHDMPERVPDPEDYLAMFGEGYDPSVSSQADHYESIDYRDDLVGRGTGFATGMGIKIGTPPEGLKFLFLSAELQGGLGLDILVKQFVQSECTSTVGINGWYGKGQGYLYAFAGVNIHLNLWFATIKKQIFSAGVGALMKVEGPNPFFARGRLDASLNALGIVDVNVKFKVKLGTTLSEYMSEECGEEFNTAENPIVDEVYPSTAPAEDGSYPGYSDFIVEMNFEPLVINKEGDIEYVFDLSDQNAYQSIINELKKNDSKSTLITAGLITVEDSEGTKIDYSLEYLNQSYPNSRKEKFNVKIKPKTQLLPGEYTIRVPALVKAKNIPDYGPYKDYKVGEWFYGEGQIGDPYRFVINDDLFQPKISANEITTTYPSKGMENFYPNELTKQALTEAGYPNLSFQPGVLIAVNDDMTYMIDSEKVPFGYTPVGIVKDKTSGNIVGNPMSFALVTFDGDKQVFVFEKNNALKTSSDYLFQFVYLADAETPIIEPYGQAWVIYSMPFRTSAFSTFKEKINQFSDQPVSETVGNDSGRKLRNMQWSYDAEESFSEEELDGESGVVVDIRFDNENRKNEYWLADNDLLWNLFEDYNDCEAAIFNGYRDPAKDIRIATSDDQISLFSNVHLAMENILRVAKEYVLTNELCSEKEGGATDQSGLEGINGKDQQSSGFCENYFVPGMGLKTINGSVFHPDFTDEICKNYNTSLPTEGNLNYGVVFSYQIRIPTKNGLTSMISSKIVRPLQYQIE